MLAVTTAMIACATVFVFFRMVSRIGIVRKVSWDDYFMILAWVRPILPPSQAVVAYPYIVAAHRVWPVVLDMLWDRLRTGPSSVGCPAL